MISSIITSKLTLNLDPKMRDKLLQESRQPYKGIRRVVWIALTASAGIGLLIMSMRFVSGEIIKINDFAIQVLAFVLCTTLVILDSPREDSSFGD